jgi:hypothetical protein
MEQLPLDLEGQKLSKEEMLSLPLEKLNELYKTSVGIDPTLRDFDKETLVEGICDPERERRRLTLIEQEENRDELSQITYHAKYRSQHGDHRN